MLDDFFILAAIWKGFLKRFPHSHWRTLSARGRRWKKNSKERLRSPIQKSPSEPFFPRSSVKYSEGLERTWVTVERSEKVNKVLLAGVDVDEFSMLHCCSFTRLFEFVAPDEAEYAVRSPALPRMRRVNAHECISTTEMRRIELARERERE